MINQGCLFIFLFSSNFFCPWLHRLNSIDYKDLKDKVASPLVNARNIIIQQSTTERFVLAFRNQVDANPTYNLPEGSPVSSLLVHNVNF